MANKTFVAKNGLTANTANVFFSQLATNLTPIAAGAILIQDSTGKIGTRTEAQILSDINAEEAIQRVQNGNPESYRGIITFEMDKEYYSKHGVAKLCIIDNGDGMTYNFLDEYLIKLGASTRKNKHPNWGAGFKLSALPFNPYGVIIRSWTKENSHGHVVWIHRNPTTGIYETKDDKVWTIRTPKPKGIDKSGTQITFLVLVTIMKLLLHTFIILD